MARQPFRLQAPTRTWKILSESVSVWELGKLSLFQSRAAALGSLRRDTCWGKAPFFLRHSSSRAGVWDLGLLVCSECALAHDAHCQELLVYPLVSSSAWHTYILH